MMRQYISVEQKIRQIASRFPNCDYIFGNYAQANVEFDNITRPTILYVLPPSGYIQFQPMRRQVIDAPTTEIWFLCPSDFDFNAHDNQCLVDHMKQLGIEFIKAINESEMFEPLTGPIDYQVAYDAYDANLTGVAFRLNLQETEGLNICE
jgi:hypothetical protein